MLVLFSFILSEWGWRNKEMANFYLAPTRAWELLSKAIQHYSKKFFKQIICSTLGITAIFFFIFCYDKTIPFLKAFLPIVPANRYSFDILYNYITFVKFTKHKTFVGIGLISYLIFVISDYDVLF